VRGIKKFLNRGKARAGLEIPVCLFVVLNFKDMDDQDVIMDREQGIRVIPGLGGPLIRDGFFPTNSLKTISAQNRLFSNLSPIWRVGFSLVALFRELQHKVSEISLY
jgi:hypothetical protein